MQRTAPKETKVVLAEKPSVARDIALVLGASTRREGFFEGNGYVVTFAFGHLVAIAEPEEMNPAWGKPWRLEQLPMIPDSWKYRVVEKTRNQFNVIKKLFCDPSTSRIICATDAGREGENIFRLIYKLTGCTKPVDRLWISSLTADAIRDGFRKLKPASDFDNLAAAASARARADWVVGLNFTRAYTAMNRQLCTIGRVQTPTLALIVDRQKEIDNFKPTVFYEILAVFEPGFSARYITPGDKPQTRIPDKAAAQAILTDVAPVPMGTVVSLVTSEKKTRAPALYDLLTLQKEANKRYGYTAQDTLDLAQSLYEEYKLLSYPRTESRHISSDMVDQLPGILRALIAGPAGTKEIKDALLQSGLDATTVTGDSLRSRLGKSYVDDTKLTDHHAIIPTNKAVPADLPERQRNIYMLVARRFMSIFLPPEVRDETTAIIKVAAHLFRSRGVVIKDPGWTVVEQRAREKEDESEQDAQRLPALAKNQQVPKRSAELKEGQTTPPKQYDDAMLLTAMKNAGQELDDEDLAAYMKQSGLGTPATRAAIIERLIQSGYIERTKKVFLPTEKGIAIIEHVHAALKDIALTASWEQRLKDMQEGTLSADSFEQDIAGFVRKLLPEATRERVPLYTASGPNLGKCPQCRIGVVRHTPKGAGCSRWKEGCKFSVWQEQYGKKLTPAQIEELVEKRRTKLIKGFKKKDGSGKFDACLVLTDDFKVRTDSSVSAPEGDSGSWICPRCKQGTVRYTPKGVGCSRWKEGCNFSVWREQCGKKLSDSQIQELVIKGKTKVIKGFRKKDGSETFEARLILTEDFRVRLDFGDTRKP